MGKASAPASPDYGPIVAADSNYANQTGYLGQEAGVSANQQFNAIWPYASQYLQQQFGVSGAQANQYQNTTLPQMQSFANTANNYNSPAQAEVNASGATADVASAFDQQRAAAQQNLESYGIDPSQTRYGALDLGTRIAQSAATAAAGTQSRLNTQATGLNLQAASIGQGSALPGQMTGVGSSGISTAGSVGNNYINALGTGADIYGSAGKTLNYGTTAANDSFNNALAAATFDANQSNAFSAGLGQLAGGALGFATGGPMLGGLGSVGGGLASLIGGGLGGSSNMYASGGVY